MINSLTTRTLSEAAAKSLSWLADDGFQYVKRHRCFRRQNEGGFSYIKFHALALSQRVYQLTFSLGVQITEVESWIHRLVGDDKHVSHDDWTICNYTVNVGPTSPHWRFPIAGDWTFTSLEEFSSAESQISEFVRCLALPYVNEHQDPLKLRRTLIETPGHATNIEPYRSILAIDCLYCSPEQTTADIAILEQRYACFSLQAREEFNVFVAAVKRSIHMD
jgi:hypothetical protein